jgi:zinc transporter ZupT
MSRLPPTPPFARVNSIVQTPACYIGFKGCIWPLKFVPGSFLIPLIVTLIALAGILIGVFASNVPELSRRAVPFSGGVLIGIAGFFILPEMATVFSWPGAILWVSVGFAALWVFDKYVYNVCPSCSHTHDHDRCSTRLHGFAGPLLAAAALHSVLDGWTLAASQETRDLGPAFFLGIAVHKLPEGLALAVIVRSALRSHTAAIIGCTAAELATLVGARIEIVLYPYVGLSWVYGLLALAAGSFLYLGYHAVDAEYKRRGALPALLPAFTGVAGSSVVRLVGGFHRFF